MADGRNHARLTMADQVVVNYLGFLLAEVAEGRNTAVAVEIMRPAILSANWHNPHVEPILRAARDLAEAFPSRSKQHGSLKWMEANLNARRALAAFFFWRGSLAHEALTNAHTHTQEHAA